MAKKIIFSISNELDITLNAGEIIYVTMLLHTLKENDEKNGIPVLCLAHGNNTASSIAEVVNTLLGVEGLSSLDAPLEQSVTDTLSQTIAKIKEINKGNGVILLADMGALCSFDTFIMEETGIPTITISNVTTALALEITRQAYGASGAIQDFWETLAEDGIILKDGERLVGSERENSEQKKFIKALSDMLSFLDAGKIYHSLKEVYENIVKDYELVRDKTFEYRFIIHCAFAVERCIKKEPMIRSTHSFYNRQIGTAIDIERYFKPVCQEFGFEMSPGEYDVILEIFCANFIV